MNNKIQNIEEISSLLQNLIPEARIAVAHGRLNGKTLESLMIILIVPDDVGKPTTCTLPCPTTSLNLLVIGCGLIHLQCCL